MFIVHVIPITKGGLEKLSYFSPVEFPIGSVIKVPLRKKEIPALVHNTEDARAIKSILRTNMYETRKVKRQKELHLFSPAFIEAVKTTAQHHATSVGSVINSYVPAHVLKSVAEGVSLGESAGHKQGKGFEQQVLQLGRKERIEKYKTIIRSTFAKGNSVFLCAPTVREARLLSEEYSRGIEKYTFVLDSQQTPKKQKEVWEAVLQEKHPVLIIATPVFTSIPRDDVGLFIIEHEMSSAYKQQVAPFVDARILVEHLARNVQCPLIFAGTTVSLKVHKALEEGFARELEERTLKLRTECTMQIIDTKQARTFAKENKKEFPVLSPESIEALQQSSSEAHSFVFAARRGIASQTVCNDCNTTVVCHRCASPVVLHKRGTERELLCHRCGTARDAHETCAHCDSWNLVPLGIGIERIEEYVRVHLPDTPVFALHSDTAKTPAQAKKIVTEFYATKGSVLIGTEMSLSYLADDIDCSVMSSIDSLLCIPDFRIEERIFSIIAMLREKTKNSLLIETSNPDNTMLKHAKRGSLSEYAQEELELRKKMHYPPYTHLVKVTFKGTRDAVIRTMQKFVLVAEDFKPRVFAGFIPRGPKLELHALIRIPTQKWPDEKLSEILNALPQSGSVDVDPERTL